MGKRRVLVVDDENDLRAAVCEMVRALGYSSIGASGGAEGLDIMTEQADAVGLILLDAHMPDLQGVEMLRRVREISPDVPVVFITGDPESIPPQDREGPGSVDILGKPFGMKELGRVVREALEVHSGGEQAQSSKGSTSTIGFPASTRSPSEK